MGLVTEDIRAKAEIIYGDEIGREKTKLLLREVGLPTGLLPLKNIIECGYVEETGFVWLKQKKKIEHKFDKVGKPAIYATEITAYVEKYKIKKLTGVKVKEMLMWVTLSDVYIDDPTNGKITFKTPTGLFRTFPASAFENEQLPEEAMEINLDAVKEINLDDLKKNAKEPMVVKEVKESMLVKEPMVVKEVKEAMLVKE